MMFKINSVVGEPDLIAPTVRVEQLNLPLVIVDKIDGQ
jgi:hypothetical protein